jgi:hypothetical protein
MGRAAGRPPGLSGRQDEALSRLQRIPPSIVDEVGFIPVDPQAANLMFMLVQPPLRNAPA